MSDNGAYESEMKDVALFESALRAAVPTRPDPSLGRTLVPRLAAAARASTVPTETRTVGRPRSRRALVAGAGIAVALIPLVLAGLAVAGVTVPKPARSAFDEIGISLPNQPAAHTHKSAATAGPGPVRRQRRHRDRQLRHPGEGQLRACAPARPEAAAEGARQGGRPPARQGDRAYRLDSARAKRPDGPTLALQRRRLVGEPQPGPAVEPQAAPDARPAGERKPAWEREGPAEVARQ